MAKNKTINVKGTEITLFSEGNSDFISLTDIARHKDSEHTDDNIKNWMRNRNTIELLGLWEQMHNPNFKPVEFDGFRKQAGLNSFTMTSQMVVSSDLSVVSSASTTDIRTVPEVLEVTSKVVSSALTTDTLAVPEVLEGTYTNNALNNMAITQMKSLLGNTNLKQLNTKK